MHVQCNIISVKIKYQFVNINRYFFISDLDPLTLKNKIQELEKTNTGAIFL